ncbi:MAG: hypothetical protein ACTSWR_10875 [Candidatus Helarchaeota archaeon]
MNLKEMLLVLKHDLHKIYLFKTHREIKNEFSNYARKADALAAFLSRNCLKEKFLNTPFRKSIIKRYKHNNNNREMLRKYKEEILELFKQDDPVELHYKLLNNKVLNLFSEARSYPYTSLKYHLILTSAIYYFLQNGKNLFKLYLTDNIKKYSEFQLIFYNKKIDFKLFIAEEKGMSKIYTRFNYSWSKRTKLTKIGGDRFLESLLLQIPSWSVALGTLEEYLDSKII